MKRLLVFAIAILIPLVIARTARDEAAPRDSGTTVEAPAGERVPASEEERVVPPGPASAEAAPSAPAAAAADLVIRGIEIRDTDGRLAWQGDVDLAPELARIEAGERDPHRNDGGIFGNREGRLPARERGYYREYVVRTPGISHAGPQRLILGRGGEVYYTPDHYESFRRVR